MRAAAAVLVQGCPGLQGPGRRCVGDHQAQVPYEKTPGSETGSVNRRARPLAVFSGGRIWGPHGEPLCPRRQRSSASPLNAMRPRTGGRIELCRYGPSIVKSTMLRRALRLSPKRSLLLCGNMLCGNDYFWTSAVGLVGGALPHGSPWGSPSRRSHPPVGPSESVPFPVSRPSPPQASLCRSRSLLGSPRTRVLQEELCGGGRHNAESTHTTQPPYFSM